MQNLVNLLEKKTLASESKIKLSLRKSHPVLNKLQVLQLKAALFSQTQTNDLFSHLFVSLVGFLG